MLHHLVNKCTGAQNSGISHHREAFRVSQTAHQFHQVPVLHFLTDQGITEQAAVYRQRGVQGIQACGDFHPFRPVHGIPAGKVHPGFFQRGPSVRKSVLHHQVLRSFGVDKRRHESTAGCPDGRHILNSGIRQHLFHGRRGAGGDLVDHTPGESHLRFIIQPGNKIRRYPSVVPPCFRHFRDTVPQLLAVMAAVVHAHHCNRGLSVQVAVIQERCRNRHGMPGGPGALFQVFRHRRQVLAVHLPQGVSLFGNCERYNLQGRGGKDVQQPVPVRFLLRFCDQGFRYGGDDFLVDGGISIQGNAHGQVIIAAVNHPDIVHVKGVRGNDSAFRVAAVQQALLKRGNKRAENVACAEMHPYRGFPCGFPHGGNVKGRQLHLCLFPCGGIPKTRQVYFHLFLSKIRAPGFPDTREIRFSVKGSRRSAAAARG